MVVPGGELGFDAIVVGVEGSPFFGGGNLDLLFGEDAVAEGHEFGFGAVDGAECVLD